MLLYVLCGDDDIAVRLSIDEAAIPMRRRPSIYLDLGILTGSSMSSQRLEIWFPSLSMKNQNHRRTETNRMTKVGRRER